MNMNTVRRTLRVLGLPTNLVNLIRDGTLEQEVERAYAQMDSLNERLDLWEASNPEAAAVAPWRKDREAWKAAGRPRCAWYEALIWHGTKQETPLQKKELCQQVLNLNTKDYRARQKALARG